MTKNIIFDLGGVLLNIDYQRTIDAFRALGHPNPEGAFTKQVQAEIFQKYEKGLISDGVFLTKLQEFMSGSNSNEIEDAWCALLGNFPTERFAMLEKLSEKYVLFILSNTNHLHQLRFEKAIDRVYGWRKFKNLFRGICYSHELNARKPDLEIFEMILDRYNLRADESFFIDDTEGHAQGAESAGIRTKHLKPGENILDVFAGW